MALTARSCAVCGASNVARRIAALAAAALVLLLCAAAVAILVATRAAKPPDRAATAAKTPLAAEDFDWLTAAMKQCDDEAAQRPQALEFMVIPLLDPSRAVSGWRKLSLNDIGNGVLLKSDDMLDGLKHGKLRISGAEYVLAVRDEMTRIVYKWSPSVGVKRFSSPDANKVESFSVQFQTRNGKASDNWGAPFERRRGTCYWVNAIILN